MAITVTLDVFEGAEVSTEATGTNTAAQKRFVRPAIVEGIDLTVVGSDLSEALFIAMTEVSNKAAANPLSGSHADMYLRKIFLRAISDQTARAELVYETLQIGGGPPSTYVLTDGAFLTTFQTNRMPGTHKPFSTHYEDLDGENRVPEDGSDRVTMSLLRPMRKLNVSALIYGRPQTGGQDAIGSVNDAVWPTSGDSSPKPVGYWLLTDYTTAWTRYGGYMQLSATALTKVREDWSETGILLNKLTGKYVDVDDTVIDALLAKPYTNTVDSPFGDGIIRVGIYPLVSFSTIMGF